MPLNHQIVAVGRQSVNDSTKNPIKKRPRSIAAHSDVMFLTILDISDAHCLG